MVSLLLMIACATSPEAQTAPATAAEAPAPEAPAAADGWATYGEAVTMDTVMPASTLLAAPQDFVGQELLVEGRVADVCQAKGCWMVIADGDQTMRITMGDHSFSVDKGGAGGDCQVQGTVVAKTVDAETVAHYASESNNTAAMPEKAEGGATYEIVATGVRMRPAGG